MQFLENCEENTICITGVLNNTRMLTTISCYLRMYNKSSFKQNHVLHLCHGINRSQSSGRSTSFHDTTSSPRPISIRKEQFRTARGGRVAM